MTNGASRDYGPGVASRNRDSCLKPVRHPCATIRRAMTLETIRKSIDLWTKEPEKARVAPAVKARTQGPQAVLETGSFSWQTDLPPPLGGENKAASPTALLLGALAGCAAVFIRDTLAPQLGVRVTSVQAEAKCKSDLRGLLGMPGAVPDLEALELSVRIESPDGEEKIQALYGAWLERCPVYLALVKPLPVKTSLTTAA
ncbi:MAG: OsmC family protein [Woeseiaceae bacterium]